MKSEYWILLDKAKAESEIQAEKKVKQEQNEIFDMNKKEEADTNQVLASCIRK